MEMMRAAGLAVAATVAVMLVRRIQPELGVAAALAGSAALLALTLPPLAQVVSGIGELADTGGVSATLVTQLLKITGISLVMEFAAQTCRDAGETGLALKAELAGRVMLLAMALPAMRQLLGQLMALT